MNQVEYWQCVEHRASECPVCSIVEDSGVTRPVGYFKALWLRLDYSAWFWWFCVLTALTAAYVVAIHELYNIVGGMG